MASLNDPMFQRQIIMDHYEYPRNKGLVDDQHYHQAHMSSDSCIDDITLQIKVNGDVIEDARFDGIACTISTASTSILTELIKGKTLNQAKEIIIAYQNMVSEEAYNADLLEEALAFQNVGKQANRINCAMIGWQGAIQIIDELEKEGHHE